ncbi:MAG: hypothetical protein P8K68_00595 [Algibacter sp.]|uniref:hypothetical protein n=1 Tax=Algibacter sp. TaxID=1872428 RepID=UPI0026082B4E|nr:hypothetical protein [Algibacter sp.]MDG1728798.1 hypothetical protein [Algibacter sp.]MDG2177271.1 hypothetical protein [Algibacter sp.]
MDELDLLKKDWNKESSKKKLSVTDIYPMLQKKSSSIVKTLFYISIAELIFWILVNSIPYFSSDTYKQRLEDIYQNDYALTVISIISYAIILLFVYLLYKSHKSISVTDSAKKLMESILKTRKVIRYYVLYNLIIAGLSLIIGFYYAMHNNPEISGKLENFSDKQMLIAISIMTLFTVVFVLVIWLFYKLIYGFLLKRLNQNYTELKKLEV